MHIEINSLMEIAEMAINVDEESKEVPFESLYEKCFPAVAGFVSKMSGSFEDAKDIFQDALVIYHEKSFHGMLNIRIAPEAYVVGIAKHLWVRKYNRDRNKVRLSVDELQITIPDDYFPTVNDSTLLSLLKTSGKKCLELLSHFYFINASANEIKEKFGYESAHSATVQKYKCIEKVRATIKKQSITYEDFLE